MRPLKRRGAVSFLRREAKVFQQARRGPDRNVVDDLEIRIIRPEPIARDRIGSGQEWHVVRVTSPEEAVGLGQPGTHRGCRDHLHLCRQQHDQEVEGVWREPGAPPHQRRMTVDFLERMLWQAQLERRVKQQAADGRILEETCDEDAGIEDEAHRTYRVL